MLCSGYNFGAEELVLFSELHLAEGYATLKMINCPLNTVEALLGTSSM